MNVGMDDTGASLLINSKEQMLTEKLRSILKFGPFSIRYKDVFDIYYLCDMVDAGKLKHCMDTLIYSDDGRKKTISKIFGGEYPTPFRIGRI